MYARIGEKTRECGTAPLSRKTFVKGFRLAGSGFKGWWRLRRKYIGGEAAIFFVESVEPRSLKAETEFHLSPSSGRGTPEGPGVGRGRGKPQANLRPFGAPPSKGRREKRDQASPYLYFAALLIFMRRTFPIEPVEPVEPVEPAEP